MAYIPPHKRHQQSSNSAPTADQDAEPNVKAIFANPFASTAPPPTLGFGGGGNPFKGDGGSAKLGGGNPFKQQPAAVAVAPTPAAAPPLDPDTLDGNIELQKEIWDEMCKALKGVVNKVCVSNMMAVTVEAFRENILRGRGVFVKALMNAQAANDEMSPVFACLVALINKFVPQVGELLIHRLLAQWKKIYWRGVVDRTSALLKFLGHLMIQKVADELLIMKILMFYLSGQSSPGDDEEAEEEKVPSESDILTAVALFKEVFPYLQSTIPEAFTMILDALRALVSREGGSEARISIKAESVIEQLLAQVREWELSQKPNKKFGARLKTSEGEKTKTPIIPEGLDLLADDEDRTPHEIDLDNEHPTEDYLDFFRHDPKFEENEEVYDAIRLDALGEELAEAALGRGGAVDDEEVDDGDFGEGDDENNAGMTTTESDENVKAEQVKIEDFEKLNKEDPKSDDEEEVEYMDSDEDEDQTGTGARRKEEGLLNDDQIVELKKQMYLLMKNSLRAEEVVHKFFKHLGGQLEKHEDIAVNLLMEACYREKTYNKKHALIAERLAKKNPKYQKAFDDLFDIVYLEKLQDIGDRDIEKVGWYFGTLLATNSIHWSVLAVIQLGNGFMTDESRLAASQRIFIGALLKKLKELMKLPLLASTLNSPKLARITQGMFPKEEREAARTALRFYDLLDVGLIAQPLLTWYENGRGKRGREDE